MQIPDEIASDRAVINLITQWRNHHLRYVVCCKRVNWKNAAARTIEKKRRREKWQLVSRILHIERTLIRWLAKATHDPEIWQSKKVDAPESTRNKLQRQYYRNVRTTHHLVGPAREAAMARREIIVTKIRALDRRWIAALYEQIYPGKRVPGPLVLHPRELYPRKLKVASKSLAKESA